MRDKVILTAEQVVDLTGYKQPRKQREWLSRAGLRCGPGKHYIVDPITGAPVVFSWWLEGSSRPQIRTEPDYSSLGSEAQNQQASAAENLRLPRQVSAQAS